jgi:LysM repeat protein
MNNQNPLLSQASALEKHTTKNKTNLVIAFFTVVTIHSVLFLGLLIQGCRPKKPVTTADQTNTNQVSTNFISPVVTQLPPVVVESPIPTNTVASNVVATTTETPTTNEVVTPPKDTVVPAATKEYTVVKNDNYMKIAKAHGITVDALTKANPNVDPKKLKISQKLVIPAPEPKEEKKVEAAKTAEGKTTTTPGVTMYTIKSGDTLNKIAKAHGTTIQAIQSANGMKTTQLQVGKKLKIPAPKATASKTAKSTTTKQ